MGSRGGSVSELPSFQVLLTVIYEKRRQCLHFAFAVFLPAPDIFGAGLSMALKITWLARLLSVWKSKRRYLCDLTSCLCIRAKSDRMAAHWRNQE